METVSKRLNSKWEADAVWVMRILHNLTTSDWWLPFQRREWRPSRPDYANLLTAYENLSTSPTPSSLPTLLFSLLEEHYSVTWPTSRTRQTRTSLGSDERTTSSDCPAWICKFLMSTTGAQSRRRPKFLTLNESSVIWILMFFSYKFYTALQTCNCTYYMCEYSPSRQRNIRKSRQGLRQREYRLYRNISMGVDHGGTGGTRPPEFGVGGR